MNFQFINIKISVEYQNLSKYIFLLDIQAIVKLINKHIYDLSYTEYD